MTLFPIRVDSSSPFPLENIPFGIFSTKNDSPHAGTAIGDFVVDLSVLEQSGLFSENLDAKKPVFAEPTLNAFAALPRVQRAEVRETIIKNLSSDSSPVFTDANLNKNAFYHAKDVKMHVPMDIPEFTDFSCFEEHVTNAAGFAGMKLMPNFYTSPIAYNGRVSSIIISGTDLDRPMGMRKDESGAPMFLPSAALDYELEVGIFVSKPLPYGKRLSADDAAEHVFGFALVNDWSARDIQGYESFPAGPFNSKSHGTSISPWVIVPEALEHAATRPLHQGDNDAPEHLKQKSLEGSIYDVDVQAYIARNSKQSIKVSITNLKHCYFSIGQILAHRASSGCGLRTGELVATGTMSSPADVRISQEYGHNACLWELSKNGTVDVPVVGGRYLEDGDRVTFDGWASGKNGKKIGFGEVTTKILPAVPL